MGIRATGSKTRPTVQSAATWMEFSHRVQRSDGKPWTTPTTSSPRDRKAPSLRWATSMRGLNSPLERDGGQWRRNLLGAIDLGHGRADNQELNHALTEVM